jgi:membrane protein
MKLKITPERILYAVKTLRDPGTPRRVNRLQALGALIMGVMLGWQEWSRTHKEESHQPARTAAFTRKSPEYLLPKQAAMVTKTRQTSVPEPKHQQFSLKPAVIFDLFKDAVKEWSDDKAPQLAAALSYYTIFSLAPLLIIAIAVAGLVFGQQQASEQVFNQIQGMVGADSAKMIQSMLQAAHRPEEGIISTIIGVVTLLAGAAGVVAQLKGALNQIWDVKPKPGPGGIKGILITIRQQLLSYAMVLGIGFLLLVSLALSALLAGLSKVVGDQVPTFLYELLNFALSFAVITVLFAAMYKVLPDTEIKWKDVWIGAVLTSLLFSIGKVALGLYLGHSGTASAYGAAGALIVILLWIYYSAQILFFGAELTQVYANQYGSFVSPETSDSKPGQTTLSTGGGRNNNPQKAAASAGD